MYKMIDLLIKSGGFIAGLLIMLTTFMTCYEVISRAFFNSPTIWATELSIYCIIGSCFLGSAYAVRTYSHITVDLFINFVSSKWKKILAYFSNSAGLVFSMVFAYYSFFQVKQSFELGVTSASLLRIPMWIPESLLFIGGILMSLAFILQLIDGGVHKRGEHI